MSKIVKPVGQGLFAAALVLVGLYFGGVSLKGPEALRDALDPFAAKTYLALIPLVPGALLLRLSDHITARRPRYTAGARISH